MLPPHAGLPKDPANPSLPRIVQQADSASKHRPMNGANCWFNGTNPLFEHLTISVCFRVRELCARCEGCVRAASSDGKASLISG
jgi:hypothetical protein